MSMSNEAASDSEEEILVYAEFEDSVNIEKCKSIHVMGIDPSSGKDPIIQVDDTFFMGKYDYPLGTYMFFEEDPSPECGDKLFDRLHPKNLKYLFKASKLLKMSHAFVTPKKPKEQSLEIQSQEPNDEIEIVNFGSVQEALERFRKELVENPSPAANLDPGDPKNSSENITEKLNQRRRVGIIVGNRVEWKASTMGYPHGSMLGPIIWNVLVDDMLRLPLSHGTSTVAYTDDVTILIRAQSRASITSIPSIDHDKSNEPKHGKLMMPSNRSRKKNTRTLEEVFKKLNRDHVQIKKKHRKRNNTILHSVLGELLSVMKTCSSMFSDMKPRLDYLGSYFDGLRVGQPTEYDINVILKFPINYDKIKLDATMCCSDYTCIVMPSEFRRLIKNPTTANSFIETKTWCDSLYRLSVKKFRSWMQSVVDAALQKFPLKKGNRVISVNNKHYFISSKMAGPANTITIVTENGTGDVIDVDLVPTFSFQLPKKPTSSKVLFENVYKTGLEQYFVVPKPSDNDFSWRLTFPFQERFYIRGKNNLKSTLKFIKLLRDVQLFKNLASYYIKSIFLWETTLQNADFWKHNSLSFLVVYMLKKLKSCLKDGEIKNFWCPGNNLIQDKIKTETCRNWSNRLSFIIRDIEQNGISNPDVVLRYFTCKKII